MKIVRLEAWRDDFDLDEPYRIAYGSFDRVTSIFVRLVTEGPRAGLGCAAPDMEVTGETPERVLDDLQRAAELLRGADPLRINHLLAIVRRELGGRPGALAAVDMALHDHLGKVAGLPLWRLLGGHRPSIETSVTLGIVAVDAMVEEAKRRVGEGFRALKLKGGANVEADIERVRRVREAVGRGVELRFDANQGFSYDDALRFVTAVAECGLSLLEQPTAKDDIGLLARLRGAVDLPIMADESLVSLADAFALARGGCVDGVNVKLVKVGGLAEAQRITTVAAAAGIAAMVGCMDESALGIAAGLALALARPGIQSADLDGHLGLRGDPAAAALRLKAGILYPAEGAGLGIDL